MKNNMKQLTLLCLALAMFVGGCTEKYEGEYDPEKDPLANVSETFEPAPEDISKIATDETFILSVESGPKTLNPLFISSGYEMFAMNFISDSMFVTDNKLNTFANPNMVDSWFENDEHTVITVKLRKDLKWHDGEPLTAHDIVFSTEAMMNPDVPCHTFKPNAEDIEKVIAIDDYTVEFTLKRALATRLTVISELSPLPKHLYEKEMKANPDLKQGKYYRHLANNPVGNGPYRLTEWIENDKLIFDRWEDYPGKKPYIKRFIYKIIPDYSMALLSFKAGDTDGIYRVTSKQCARETNDDEFAKAGRKIISSQWAFGYTGWNMDGSNPFFIDKDVRYAMAYAYNFEMVKNKLSYNLLTKCYGIYHPDSWMYNDTIEPIRYDLLKAVDLLENAGWKLEDDGWRYKDVKYVLVEKEDIDKITKESIKKVRKVFIADKQEYTCKAGEVIKDKGTERRKFEFTYLSTPSNGLPRASTIIYQQDLRKIGINMKIRLLEWTSFMQRTLNHDTQAWGAAWGAGTDPDGGKGIWRVADYDNGRNYGGYANPAIDKLYEKGIIVFDQEERAEIYRQIHKIIYEDQPYLFVYNPLNPMVIHKRIRGNFDCSFSYCFTYPYTRELWVPKEEAIRPVNDKN